MTYLVYQPGLAGSFIFDDGPNITDNTSLTVRSLDIDTLAHAALSSASGPLRRPISMLSFAFNYYATGFQPYYFKLTNLFIHLGNGLGVYLLSAALLSAYRRKFQPALSLHHGQLISLAITFAWLLHPLNLTGVLYVVQRMTSLSALFSFWGLYLYTDGRNRLLDGRKHGLLLIVLSLFVFTPLALLSKESGALMPLLMLVIECSFFRFQTSDIKSKRALQILFFATVALPASGLLIFLASHPGWLPTAFIGRSFTLSERLMTEPRILWFYLSQIFFPDLKQLGLFHDDIANSSGFMTPITTVPAILGILGLLGLAWFARNKLPILSFGILFFFAGHALESTIFPLEITFEHRNYLPMFGLLFAAMFYLLYPLRYTSNLRLRQVAAVLFIGILSYYTYARAVSWSNSFEQAKDEVEHHPRSARDNGNMANSLANIVTADPATNDFYYAHAIDYFTRATSADRNYTTGLVSQLMLSAERGKPLDPSWIGELRNRLQNSYLDNDVGNTLALLVTCKFKEVCQFQNDDLYALLQAALSNPTVVAGKRSLVYSALSYYHIDIARNYQAAIDDMRQSVAFAPQEPQFRYNLIKVLIALNRFDEAKIELAGLKKADTLHAFDAEIASKEKQINDRNNGIAK